ncbi:MAG: hypothetical protein GX838_00740 [Clostridiaceae bacterium]|nr:hypothetical protein [Clostridiaceae bacterium]
MPGPGIHPSLLKFGGSISLALCLVLPVVLILFHSILLHSRRTRAEVDLARGTALTAESILALYDRDLYRQFGLFAYDCLSAERACSSLIGPDSSAGYHFTPKGPLSDPSITKEGIARHMTLRSVTSLITDAVDKFGQIRALKQEIPVSDLNKLIPGAANSGYESADPVLSHQTEADWFEEYNDYMNDELRAAYQQGLSNLAPALIPSQDGSMEIFSYDPFDNSGIDRLGTFVDYALLVAPEGFLDRIILAEYTLSYFKNDVPYVVRNGVRAIARTPDGRVISSFSSLRDQEAEEIATGFEGGRGSYAMTLFIGTIRFVMRLLHVLTDEAQLAGFEIAAGVVVSAVAAITLGEVVLPPEVVMWVLIASAVLGQVAKDTFELQRGQEVNLWPGASSLNVPMRYRDYLRLLIVLQPPDVIAERVAPVIGRVVTGPHYTEVSCCGSWADVSVTHAASYLPRDYVPALP